MALPRRCLRHSGIAGIDRIGTFPVARLRCGSSVLLETARGFMTFKHKCKYGWYYSSEKIDREWKCEAQLSNSPTSPYITCFKIQIISSKQKASQGMFAKDCQLIL